MYTIKKAGETNVILFNDQPMLCPFRTSAVGANKLGQPQFINQSCDSMCPLFQHHVPTAQEAAYDPPIKETVTIYCGGQPLTHTIEKPEAKEIPIIKLK